MAAQYQGTNEAARWLFETWSEALLQSIEAMTGERPAAERSLRDTAELDASFRGGAAIWWEQPVTLGSDARIWIGASEPSWFDIGRQALAAAGIDDGSREDYLSTYKEILNQSLSTATQALTRRVGREVNAEGGKESAPPAGSLDWFTIVLLNGETDSPPIYVVFSAPLVSVLADKPAAAGAEERETATAGSSHSGPGSPIWSLAPMLERSKTLDVLLEVELPVCVSFGRAQLPLRDVLKLTSGSIVELNRTITEPVEVIVNNCVIARGEVVVIEGNYGVRIQQIVSREERLRTLH